MARSTPPSAARPPRAIVLIPPEPRQPCNIRATTHATAVAVEPTTGDDPRDRGGRLVSPTSLPCTSFNTLYRLNSRRDARHHFRHRRPGQRPSPRGSSGIGPAGLAVQANGDILLVRRRLPHPEHETGEINKLELLRLNPDGSTDATFGNTSTPGLLRTHLTDSARPSPGDPGRSTATSSWPGPGPSRARRPDLRVHRSPASLPPPAATGPALPPADAAGRLLPAWATPTCRSTTPPA